MTHTRSRIFRRNGLLNPIAAALCAASALVVATASQQATASTSLTTRAPFDDETKWLRVVEEDGGEVIKLQLVSREYRAADGTGPSIFLTGAVHVADSSFYSELQTFLDAKDVVLFEGVKPPGAGHLDHDELRADDESLAKATTRRIRFVSTFIERHKRAHKEYPASLDELVQSADGRVSKLLAGSLKDAWGNPLTYTVVTPPTPAAAPSAPAGDAEAADGEPPAAAPAPRFDLSSLGADGKLAGDGPDADLAFSDQPPLKKAELVEGEGIQRQLAAALRLKFQLDAMDDTKPNWRNSDLSVDQVMDRLEASGADAGQLFSMIGGGGLMDAAVGVLAKVVGMSKTLSTMLKMAMVDMLTHADDMLAGAGGDMGKMMEVIIHDRNDVVISDLSRLMRDEKELRTIGIIYGAGHLPDLDERMRRELQLEPVGETWFTAITVKVADTGMSAAEASRMRRMLRSQIEKQMKTMRGKD